MDQAFRLSEAIEPALVRVLGPSGTAGTGFIVDAAARLLVTCAHVVSYAGAGPGTSVELVHHRSGRPLRAAVVAEFWREPEDVAVLRADSNLPPEARAVALAGSGSPVGHPFLTFGFPEAKPVEAVSPRDRARVETLEAQLKVLEEQVEALQQRLEERKKRDD